MVATDRFDALVVGAGPAGSTAAFRLARAGARVLLVDKARFPRDKPCGGGLTVRAVRLLPFSVAPVVEEEVDVFELGLGFRRRFVRRTAEPLVVMTQRRRLDAFLVEQAQEAGAEFRDGTTAEGVEATVVIGADGVNGTTARALGRRGHVHEVALEGNVPYGPVSRRRYARRAVVEFGIVPGGYGWVFPKGDHINVGVGGWLHQGPWLREHLGRLCRFQGIPEEALTDVRGYRLPLRRPEFTPARGRTALVGDAAGLVDPVSGDGIYEALLSARLAAENALEIIAGRADDFRSYAGTLDRALALSAAASWRAKLALERFPNVSFTLLQAPYAWRAMEKLLRADATHPGAIGGPGGAALRAAELLARLAGDPGKAFARTA
ncbi:MAG: geranylgeranyl reductase family protein [Gaiellaceae bacterium]